jgi:hypothetical protein
MAIGIGRPQFVAALRSATSLAWPLASPAQPAKTTIRRLVELSAAALAASTIACSAGPCSPAIGRMQARLDAGLEANARTGPSAPESPGALLHREPTPGSIASAEIRLGEISPEKAKIISEAMARAREADQAGDKAACEQALAEVQRTISP